MLGIFSRYRVSLLSGITLGILAFVPVSLVSAQNTAIITNLPGCNFQTGWLKAACIPVFIGHLIQVVFGFIGAIFIVNVIIAGYQIAKGSWEGDKAAGKDRLTYSIIGLIVASCAYLILNLVLSVILT